MTAVSKLGAMKWRKISAPAPWRPSPGDGLTGYYVGRTRRDGRHGQYEVLIVAVPYKGTYMISGTQLLQLADAAMISRGDAIRVRYQGNEDLDDGKYLKLFEMWVGETERAEDLPVEQPPS